MASEKLKSAHLAQMVASPVGINLRGPNAFLPKRDKLANLETHLGSKILGQSHLIPRVTSVLTRGELGLANPKRPLGSFLFVGPSGVGKTELANVASVFLFNGQKPVRFDMSEYQLQTSVEKLIGSGSRDSGLLGRALSGVTEGILLFDEIEKAHPLILDLFLQILDDASITYANGIRQNLNKFYVILTSNIGSSEVMRMARAPLATIERTVLYQVSQQLRPELVGRINEKLVFASLSYECQRQICEQMCENEIARLRALGHALSYESPVIDFLLRAGFSKYLGARPLREVVDRNIQGAISEAILAGEKSSGRLLVVSEFKRLGLKKPSLSPENSRANLR